MKAADVAGTLDEVARLTRAQLPVLRPVTLEQPVDHLVVDKIDAPQTARVVEGDIPSGLIGVDIGPRTIALYCAEIANAGTVVWNGPLGKYEDEAYSRGTRSIAEALTQTRATTIVGGGETAEAVEEFGLDGKITHVSTGGGAFLEFVEGKTLPAVAILEQRARV